MDRSTTPTSQAKRGESRIVDRPRVHIRSGAQTLAVRLALGAAFTSPWTAVRIAGVNVADFLLVAATLSALFVAVRDGRRLPIFLWATLPPCSLLAIAAVNAVVRDHPLWSQRMADEWAVGSAAGAGYGGAAPLILRMALAMTTVAAIVAGAADSSDNGHKTVERIIRFWAVGAAVSAFYGVVSFSLFGNRSPLSGTPFLYHVVSETRVAGLASHPNSFGQTLAVALPVLIYMIGVTRGLGRASVVTLVAMSFYGIILSGSRADIALGSGLAAVTLLCIIFTGKKLNPWISLALVLSLPASMLLVPKIVNSLRFGSRSGEVSTGERTASLGVGLDLFNANPILGAGVGSWGAEMVPLIVLTSGGVVFFAIFYGSLALPLWRRSHLPRTLFVRVLTIAALGVLAFGLVNNAIVERYLYWPFAALFALSLIHSSRPEAQPTNATPEEMR